MKSPYDIPEGFALFEVLVIYGCLCASAFDEGDARCDDDSERASSPCESEGHVVSLGVFATTTADLAKSAAAKALGYGSVGDWYQSLDFSSDVPVSIQTEERTFRSLSQEQWERLAVISDS
jgi:hypothetical protein